MTADKASAPADGLVERLNRRIERWNPDKERTVKRLRNPDGPEAAATITRLRADLEEARGLLEPFASHGYPDNPTWQGDDCPDWSPFIAIKHYQAARAFLTRTEPRHG